MSELRESIRESSGAALSAKKRLQTLASAFDTLRMHELADELFQIGDMLWQTSLNLEQAYRRDLDQKVNEAKRESSSILKALLDRATEESLKQP